ncbi:unnamed protein product [Trichobilharzia regenti]|nr:unnamed protein product [Trichobilharzia regenti]
MLNNDPSDHLSVAYHLIIDNKRFGSVLNPEEVNNFYVATGIDSPSATTANTPSSPTGSSANSHCASATQSLTPNYGQVSSQAQSALAAGAAAASGMKRFKWHLGIRSQSRPWDIMHEVFKAMNSLGYEWKVVNPFNVRVRKWNPILQHYSRLVLQLYQVDARSYLLDFKCIDESQLEAEAVMGRIRSNNMSVCLDSCSGTPPAAMGTSTYSADGSLSGSTGSASPLPTYASDGLNAPELSRSFTTAYQEVPVYDLRLLLFDHARDSKYSFNKRMRLIM